jgi:hypothetical protein
MSQVHKPATREIGWAITQVLALYGHVMDRRGASSLSDVFTDDATFDVTSLGGPVYQGLNDLEAFLALDDAIHPPFHVLTNAFVYEDRGVVRSLSKWLTVDRETGLPRSGDYRDEWRLTAGGWRIAERVALSRWPGGPWTHGYSNGIDARLRENASQNQVTGPDAGTL